MQLKKREGKRRQEKENKNVEKPVGEELKVDSEKKAETVEEEQEEEVKTGNVGK